MHSLDWVKAKRFFEFVTQTGNMHVHSICWTSNIPIPYIFKQSCSAQNSSTISHEIFQQRKFLVP